MVVEKAKVKQVVGVQERILEVVTKVDKVVAKVVDVARVVDAKSK
jgi:hypothetical protein